MYALYPSKKHSIMAVLFRDQEEIARLRLENSTLRQLLEISSQNDPSIKRKLIDASKTSLDSLSVSCFSPLCQSVFELILNFVSEFIIELKPTSSKCRKFSSIPSYEEVNVF